MLSLSICTRLSNSYDSVSVPQLYTSPRTCLETFQEQDFQISSILQESRLSTRDGMRSHRVTTENNCCKKMLSSPEFYVTVEALFHSYHWRQIAKWWKKTFQETDTDLFQVFASHIITYLCPLLSSMPAWILISKQWSNSRLARLQYKHTQITWKKFKKLQVPHSVHWCLFTLHVQRKSREFWKIKLKSRSFWRNQLAENANLV